MTKRTKRPADEQPATGYGGFSPPTSPHAVEKLAFANQDRYLMAFAECGNVGKASEIAGISRFAVYDWVDADRWEFRRRYSCAQSAYADSREQLMHDRLADPEGNRGSDILLMFQIKALRPEKYREVVGSGEDDKVAIAELRKLAREERKRWQEQQGARAETNAVEEAEALLEAKRGGGEE